MAIIKQTFTIVDYIVFSLTVLASVAIGIYFAFTGRKKNTTLNYFHGDRKLKYGPVALSLVVTFQSSIMLLGFPAEVYLFGYMICLFNIGQCAAIFLATKIIVPLMYPLKITSVYHYLQLRYGNNSVRILSVTIGIISQSIYMGIVLLGPAIALQSVTEIPIWTSILCIALAAIIYTSIGGILAVIWTDVLQCFIIIIGILSTLIKGTIDTGGVSVVFQENIKTGRLDMLNFSPNPTIRHTFWTVLIGSFIGSFSLTLSQSTIQRFNSTPTIGDAKKVLFIAGPVFIVMQTLSMSVGLVCFAYYTVNACDPISSGRIRNPNQIVPYMIAEIFRNYPGLSGLFISALFSASLSTLSSILAGLSAVTVEDFIRPHFTLSDSFLTVIAKVTVVVYGGVGIAVAFIISQLEGSLTQILFSVMGAATGPLVGIFFLSMFFRRATDKGAIIGGITGIVFTFWICIGSTVSRDIPRPRPLQLPPILHAQSSIQQ
ncbi:sodium-coupled monocarboxylate transporter 1-like [Ruditapes philippinarum]|uniref:sodium-coupled monocarboxylate transporter 1-like n=1 Tax=Ruditapes philippinarum TaxID=129788 RepID=UPI00295C315B|nr:sodium-coupled monocarboxylate transporter 1-like [Ruditapes philippinarum]